MEGLLWQKGMLKDITWGPVGWSKIPRMHGIFTTDTPQVVYLAYISELTRV